MSSDTFPDVARATNRVELDEIIIRHGREFLSQYRLPLRHLKVMRAIVACRTAVLGGHHQHCEDCGYQRFVYHSCRNRHCPKCQTQAKEAWREARQLELLPVPYFHQVFTLPHELNQWVLAGEENQRALLKLLFDAASATLLEFGRGEFGGQVGFTLILHTWDQQLRPHFHVHGLMAAGALADDGSCWRAGGNQFLFPVRALSKKFRGKFLAGFEELLEQQKLKPPPAYASGEKGVRSMVRTLRRKSWVVYSKRPFSCPAKLLDYLSRYTHRVAISNGRLIDCNDGNVTFSYRDRSDGDQRKQLSLPAQEFLRRFLTHVLPDRFMRIRHYGFLSNGNKAKKLAIIRNLLGAESPKPVAATTATEWLKTILGIDPNLCPECGGTMLSEELPCDLSADHRRLCRNSPDRNVRGPPITDSK